MNLRKPIRIIKASEIKQNYSMQKAINAMEGAFASLSSGASFVPQRFVTTLPTKEMFMLFKPAFVEKDKRVSIKLLTQREGVSVPGIPTIQGIILVIDSVSGEILSLMDGEYVTALRTGAACGLATRFFALEDAQTMAIFGCGTQGRTQLEAVLCERKIKKVFVFDKFKEAADRFIQEMQEKFQIELIFAEDTNVLSGVDIICTATNSMAPLFKKEDIKEGVHINAVGSFQPQMQELDPVVVKDAKVFVDQLDSCLAESGDLIKPLDAGIIQKNHVMGEIGDFCLNKISGRESEKDITVFKSVGVAIQDYAVATDIYNNAQKKLFGTEIDLFS